MYSSMHIYSSTVQNADGDVEQFLWTEKMGFEHSTGQTAKNCCFK